MRNKLRGRKEDVRRVTKLNKKLKNDFINYMILKLAREAILPPQGFQPAMKKLRNFPIPSISVFLVSNV
jgi:hypothetical protein